MRRPTLTLLLLLLVLGILLWRETRHGSLVGLERSMARWSAQAAGMKNMPSLEHPPTLVFHGGLAGEKLEALEIGLFARAARILGARVAAVATYDFPSSEIRLTVPEGEAGPRHIAGTLLMERPARAGLAPLALPSGPGHAWRLEQFRGSFSAFPPDRGWQGGFLNLPTRSAAAGTIVLVADLEEKPVASFALAAHLAAHSAAMGRAPEVRFLGEDGLQIGQWLLPVAADGSLPLQSRLLPTLQRLDLDDVLIEVERQERGRAANPEVRDLIAGRTVLFGTLADGGMRLEGGRQFSLVEFHGLGLASVQAALVPLPAPWWGEAGALLFALGAVLMCRRSHVGRSWAAYVGWVAAWVALVLATAGNFGVVLPGLFPAVLITAGWVLSPLFPPRG